MIHLLVSIFLVVLFCRIILRLIFRPFGWRHRHHHHFGWRGYNDGYDNPYGYGYRRRGFGSIAPIFLLVALDRIFGRRW
jgi:hypothetical protein